MSSQKNTLLTLFASIAALLFKPPTRRAIVAQDAKRPFVIDVEPVTTIPQYVPFVEPGYPPANNGGPLVIVVNVVNQQPQSGVNARPDVLPLNRGLIRERYDGNGPKFVNMSPDDIAAYYAGERAVVDHAPDVPRQGWER